MPMLTVADIAMIALIGLSGLFAFVRGFVRELFGVGSWIGAAVITFFGYPFSTQLGRELIENRLFAEVAGIAGLFVISLVTFSLIAHVVSDQVRDSIFSGVDRALGLAFGLIRGLFVVAVVLLGIHNFVAEEKLPDWYKESSLAPIILKYSQQGLHEATKNYGVQQQDNQQKDDEKQGGEKPDGQQQDGNKDGATSSPPHDGQHGDAAPNHPTPSNPTANASDTNNASPAAPAPAPTPAPAATPSAKPGYGIEERKRLDDLFTKKP